MKGDDFLSRTGTVSNRSTCFSVFRKRPVNTVLGQQGVAKDWRDRLHGHAMTDVSSKHYDRHDYLDEKRQAMAAWDR